MGNASFKNRKILDPKNKETTSFGNAVAISGNTVVVADSIDNRCYIFIKESGEFKYLQTLESEDSTPAGGFGTSVAIDGAHIVVGAPGENDFAGRAYVFTKQGNKFVRNSEHLVSGYPTQRIENDDDKITQFGGGFGYSVAIDGAHIVVGAPGENDFAGRAYVFTKQGNKFVRNSEPLESGHPTQMIENDDGITQVGGGFGASVEIDGANIVVGASGENSVAGRAYVFTKKGNKFVRNSDPLESEHPRQDHNTVLEGKGGYFGYSVSIDGAHIVVGAYGENELTGRAYVFTKQGNKFVRNSEPLVSGDPKGGFGGSVAIDGSHIVVGAVEFKNEDGTIIGRAYTFTKQGTKFVRNSEPLEGDNPPVGKIARFGGSVAIDGAHIVVGNQLVEYEDGTEIGKAYTFTLSV